jgi:hypothetical protein
MWQPICSANMSTKNLATQSQAPTHPSQPLPCASTEAKQADALAASQGANLNRPTACAGWLTVSHWAMAL